MRTASAQPTIRRATADDAEAIAGVLTVALADKYRPALGRQAARAVSALVRADVGSPAAGYFVAEWEGALVGVAHLALDEAAGAGLLAEIAREVGWPRALRAAAVLMLLGGGPHGPDAGYVDEVAVAAGARRRGAARALLGACEEAARRAGKRRLTLWVTSNNDPALALYRSAGFRPARRRRWVLGRLLFRAPGALYMEKRISSPP
jgi:ribosomal protein S18 acetylase RimI-like enzyme